MAAVESRVVSWADTLDLLPEEIRLSRPSSVHVTEPKGLPNIDQKDIHPALRYRTNSVSSKPAYRESLTRPLPTRTSSDDVPARKTFVWTALFSVFFSTILLGFSAILIALSDSNSVEGGAIWNLISAIMSIPLSLLSISNWHLPNTPSIATRLYHLILAVLWTTTFIVWSALAGLHKEEDFDPSERHNSLVGYNDQTPHKIETLMIWMAFIGLFGLSNALFGWYNLRQGDYQASLIKAHPAIRASMLMMQPGPAKPRGGSMSSEYPDTRAEDNGPTRTTNGVSRIQTLNRQSVASLSSAGTFDEEKGQCKRVSELNTEEKEAENYLGMKF